MYTRTILERMKPFLETHDILLLYGARQVGKTSLMKIIQADYISHASYFFDLENRDYLSLLNNSQNIFIEYLQSYHGWDKEASIVVFIDEVQYLDNPTSFLKYIHDHYPMIKLIVSGSSTLEIRGKLQDSLVGRMIQFDILPLSFQEFLTFKQKDNLAKLVWKKNNLDIINDELLFFYKEYAMFWWYPKVVLSQDAMIKQTYLKQIYTTYIQKDIQDIGRIKEVEKFNILIRLLAHQSGSLVNVSEISNTIWITIKTLQEWLLLLENTFVIKFITPFSTNLRWELTKMPKLFFIDNGLRNCIDESYELTGSSFENSFFNHIQNSYTYSKINFYRTQDKKEIDFVLDSNPYELKLHYNGKNNTALRYFEQKYYKRWTIITLQKMNNDCYEVLYPWEI